MLSVIRKFYPIFQCLILCCVLVMAMSMRVQAQDLPSRESLVQRLEQMQHAAASDPDAQAQTTILRDSIANMDRLASLRKQREALEKQIASVPEQLQKLNKQLGQLDHLPDQARMSADASSASLETMENRLIDVFNNLKQLQQDFGDANRQVTAAQTVPERAQVQIASLQNELQQLHSRLNGDNGQLSENVRHQLVIKSEAIESEIGLNQRQLINNTQLRDLAMAKRDLAARRLSLGQTQLRLLQQIVNQKRSEQSQQAVNQARKDTSSNELDNPLVREAVGRNGQLAEDLVSATDNVNHLIGDSITIRNQLDAVQQVQANLNDQVAAVRGSVLLSRILRQQREALPTLMPRPKLSDQIADVRLKQFDIGQSRETLADVNEYVARLLALQGTPPQGEASQLTATLVQLYQAQRELLDQLDREYSSMLTLSIDMQLNQQQLNQIGSSVRASIDEQLFWIASGRPLDLTWVKQLPSNLMDEITDPGWRMVLEELFSVPSLWTVCVLPMFALLVALSVFRPRIQRYLLKLQGEIGHIRQDTQWHTPLAILLNLILPIRGPLLLASIGVGVRLSGSDAGLVIGGACLTAAFAWGYFAWARRLLVDDGVAMTHFHWPKHYVRRLRVLINQLGIASVPVVLIIYLIQHFSTSLVDQPAALLIVMVGYLAISIHLAKIILSHVPEIGLRLFRVILGVLISMVPLFLAGLVIWGFEYTAVRLTPRFITTIYLLGLWVVVASTVVRGLAVAARRLSFKRALERRRASQPQSQGSDISNDQPEEPPLDMDQVNKQSLRLSKMIILLVFISLFYVVWHDLLGVLSYLQTIDLWQVDQSVAGVSHAENISLGGVCLAIIVIVLTWFMSSNLPGMLEVMVLSRLDLKTGTAYAVSSLLSYTILGVGIVVSLGMLGVTWSKLQWLIAALGVGLGFGLQEIFANFISGLIILFERPVRIGDTITLNQMDGTVSRIRIRATTVIDFDNKEIIVPNKTFITDRLINWSLSDNVTRVVMHYGVEHDADLDKVRTLLYSIAHENERVLKDPEPTVFCMSADTNAINFELRVYVSEVGERLPTKDEINRRVTAIFRQEGISIAFQQMDVWLHNSKGESRQIEPARSDDI